MAGTFSSYEYKWYCNAPFISQNSVKYSDLFVQNPILDSHCYSSKLAKEGLTVVPLSIVGVL